MDKCEGDDFVKNNMIVFLFIDETISKLRQYLPSQLHRNCANKISYDFFCLDFL